MDKAVVIVGIGEMGGVFARSLLRTGYPVFPVVRGDSLETAAALVPAPEMVLVAVAEADLEKVLAGMPTRWRDRIALLQNELLPRDWLAHDLEEPTVISVWFEKKKGAEARSIVPSPVFGPHASLLSAALGSIDIPTEILSDPNELLFELVRKNLYILTANLCGLKTGGTVEALWRDHEPFARAVGSDILDLQEWLTGKTLDRERLTRAMLTAFEGDPDHLCMGRSAPARLDRAIALANKAGLEVPRLRELVRETASG
ncbi:MAG: hypothetical protein U9R74_15920 [Pseudomonadota bacterium]|nr:hypothetical protein [Pseudomonadota bacterium]